MRNRGRCQRCCRVLLFAVLTVPVVHATNPSAALQEKTVEAIARAMHLTPTPELTSAVHLLRPVSPFPDGTDLRVMAVIPAGARDGWFVRLGCERRRDCIPYFALLHASGETTFREHQGLRSAQPNDAPRLPKEDVQERVGDRVEVVEEVSGIHFKAHAVCLQAGSLGDRIRVRNLATRRVLTGTIAGESLVRVEREP